MTSAERFAVPSNSAFSLDEKVVAEVLQEVRSVRPDLACVLETGTNAATGEELESLSLMFTAEDGAWALGIVQGVLSRHGMFLAMAGAEA